MSKGFVSPLIIGIIILVLTIAGGAFYVFNNSEQYKMGAIPTPPEIIQQYKQATPTPVSDKTANPDSIGANWKTYTNKEGTYSIKYLPDWKAVSEGSLEIKETTAFGKNIADILKDPNIELSIEVEKPTENIKTLVGYKDFWINIIKQGGGTLINQSSASIAGVTGYKLTFIVSGKSGVMYLLQNNGLIYTLTYGKNGQAELSPSDQNKYELILSTFKFQ